MLSLSRTSQTGRSWGLLMKIIKTSIFLRLSTSSWTKMIVVLRIFWKMCSGSPLVGSLFQRKKTRKSQKAPILAIFTLCKSPLPQTYSSYAICYSFYHIQTCKGNKNFSSEHQLHLIPSLLAQLINWKNSDNCKNKLFSFLLYYINLLIQTPFIRPLCSSFMTL